MLTYPRSGASIALTTDDSATAVGAVLEQLVDGEWQPLVFFSRQLRPPELKYSAFDSELLALDLAVHHFRCYLEGRPFTAYTDRSQATDFRFLQNVGPLVSKTTARPFSYI